MNTKKVGILILSAIVAGVVVSGTNANIFRYNGDINDNIQMRNNIEEKKAERQAECDTRIADREEHMGVIKKLIDGEELTNDEQSILSEIKEKRAEREEFSSERQGRNEERKEIMDKLLNGENLTDDEKTTLEQFKSGNGGMLNRGGGKKGGMGMHR